MKDLEHDNLDNNHLDNHKVNINENVSDASPTKTHQSNRTGGIYERFLNRIQKPDSGISDVKSDNTIKESHPINSYEPLSDTELSLVTQTHQTINAPKANIILNDEYGEYKAIEPLSQNSLVAKSATNLVSNQPAASDSKQRGHLKSMIAGIVCGLLLSIFIILVVNTTGVLDTLTERFFSKTAPISTTNHNEPTVSSEPLNSERPVIKTDVKTDEVNREVSSVDKTAASSNLTDETANIDEPKEKNSTSSIDEANDSNTESSISYEDFREEAKNTLYRDIKD